MSGNKCTPVGDAVAAVGPSATADAPISIAALDDVFAPACVEVRAGDVITIVVRNAGAHPHNLTLPDDTAVSVDAGQVAFINASIGATGLRFVCTLHEQMTGELRVVAVPAG